MEDNMQVTATTPESDYMAGWDDPIEETVETEEVTEVEAEESQQTEEQEEATEDTTEEAETEFDWKALELKYLKDTKKLGELEPSEVQALLQKGMDYQRQVDKLEPFKELSELYNIPLEKIHETLIDDYLKAKADEAGTTFELEKRQYDLDKRERLAKKQEEAEAQKKAEADSEKAATDKMMRAFVKAYPDVKEDSIPDSVWAKVKDGASLLDAYATHENAELKAQLKKLEKQLENQKTSPVKSVTKLGQKADTGKDPDFGGIDWSK